MKAFKVNNNTTFFVVQFSYIYLSVLSAIYLAFKGNYRSRM